MKFKMIKDIKDNSERTTFTVTATMTGKVMYELGKYGIEQFDRCYVNMITGEMIAVAVSECEAKAG